MSQASRMRDVLQSFKKVFISILSATVCDSKKQMETKKMCNGVVILTIISIILQYH